MKKIRIKFNKIGKMIYISHLDLMRCMSRAFVRANVSIYHTEGFNPHPYMVFANSLSLGYAGLAELLDVQIPDDISTEHMKTSVNAVLPEGLSFLEVYEEGRPLKEISYAKYYVDFNQTLDLETLAAVDAFLKQDSIIVEKKTKKGIKDIDIAPMIQSKLLALDGKTAQFVLACSDTQTLNPELLMKAAAETVIDTEMIRYTRQGFLDAALNTFR